MAGVTLNPYINFTDNAEEVINFYKQALGAEAEITRFDDPSAGMPVDDKYKNLVMHSVVKVGDLQIMISDSAPMGPAKTESNVSLSLSGDDEATLTKYYNALSEGGTIEQPLKKAPWGDTFGMFTDKFGVHWMVNISGAKPA